MFNIRLFIKYQTITGKNAGDSPLYRAGHSAVLGKSFLRFKPRKLILTLLSLNVPLIFFFIFFFLLGPDDSIYIYGGYSQSPIPREKALMILDTKKWEYVHLSDDSSPAVIQAYHTATIYKDLMIISFGMYFR